MLKDIEPYVCLFPDCEDATAMFRSSDSWPQTYAAAYLALDLSGFQDTESEVFCFSGRARKIMFVLLILARSLSSRFHC